ncbi:MAG: hypothetical protein VR64_21670 [Desulfatitalea sp. BRH_c12]|nr:MAG: hypothetical protein VR64_21670 [Desulfatitalea sp. BRH_c12]
MKEAALYSCLHRFTRLGVAFSGGVDSTVLLAAAFRVLGSRVVALTAMSPIHPSGEKEASIEVASRMGVTHILFPSQEMDDPAFTANSPDRCYHCKTGLFSSMGLKAADSGITVLAHGANVDDLSDYRPGFRAAHELGVVAPLIEAGLNKADVRGLARRWGLENWNRPAMACLATRIPYGTPIQLHILKQIDRAEAFLRELGVLHCRVRHYGNLARIETGPEQIALLIEPGLRERIVTQLRQMGYAHICLDLEGYAPGKMNRDIEKNRSCSEKQ